MRRPLMAANWKMYKTTGDARDMLEELVERLGGTAPDDRDVLICPPATALGTARDVLDGTGIAWGGQNMYPEPKGAFTGEISPVMLWDLGCTYVIVGHSERRQIFEEPDDWVNRKVKAVLRHHMVPILCVGETLEEREDDLTEERVTSQLRLGLQGVSGEDVAGVVVAYEPIWAIGTGRAATPQDAGEVIASIRTTLASMYSEQVAVAARVQYGGSVKAGNIREFMAHPEIDGALVGGASLDPEELALIVKYR